MPGDDPGHDHRRKHADHSRAAGPARTALCTAIAAATIACSNIVPPTPNRVCPPIIERAIEARGGSLSSFRRVADSRVYIGFPGDWRFEYAFHVPHHYRWTVFTSEQADHYSWDGQTMRAAVGNTVIGVDSSGRAPLRTHALWNAITALDSLCTGAIPAQIIPIRPKSPQSEAVLVRLEDGSEYRLDFDARSFLVKAVGPIEMTPFGTGELVGEYFDFRHFGGFTVSTRARFRYAGRALSEETTISFVGNDPTINLQLFRGEP